MTYQIERLAKVYSAAHGEHMAWRALGDHKWRPAPLQWRTKREAEGFMDMIKSSVHSAEHAPVEYRVVEVSDVEE